MEDSKRKRERPQSSITQQMISDDQTFPDISPHQPSAALPPQHPPVSSSIARSSSSSAERELVQEVKNLKLTTEEGTTPQETPLSPRIPISSISPAYFRPHSRRPRQPPPVRIQQAVQRTQLSVPPASESCKQGLAAQLWLMKPKERIEFKRSGQLQRKKREVSWNRDAHASLSRPSGFGPGPSPYETVQKALTELKEFINMLTMEKETKYSAQTVSPHPLPFQDPVTAHATSSSSTSTFSSGASYNVDSKAPDLISTMDVDVNKAAWTVEEVIDMVEEYLKRVPRTVSFEEMEEGLVEIQRSVGVDLLPTWYGLMSKSYMDFWEYLTGHFECQTIKSCFKSGQEEGDFDSGSSGPNSSAPNCSS